MFKKLVTIALVSGLLMTNMLQASAVYMFNTPIISTERIEQIKKGAGITFTQSGGAAGSTITDLEITDNFVNYDQGIKINFCINTQAYVTVGIAEYFSNGSYTGVKTLDSNELYKSGCHERLWDAKYDNGSAAKSSSDYYYWISATNKSDAGDKENATDFLNKVGTSSAEATNDTTTSTSIDEEDLIDDLTVSPSKISLYDNDEAEIRFTLTEDAEVDIKIYENSSNKVVNTLISNKDLDADDYRYKWDGTDEDGDPVEEDKYYVKVTAETRDGTKDIDKEDILVKDRVTSTTNSVSLKNVLATKESIDTDRDEETFIAFATTSESDIAVKLYDGTKLLDVIYEKNNASAGTFYAKWDGTDKYGETLPDGEYTFKVYAENDRSDDMEEVDVTLERDVESSKVPNIYQDNPTPVFKPIDNNKMSFNFRLSTDAEITVKIYSDGGVIANVASERDLPEGQNTIKWNGLDDYGRTISDGVYQYKIIASTYAADGKEEGSFMLAESYKKTNQQRCAGFLDMYDDNEYCDAVSWATEKEIFEGYDDNTFRADTPISRVEALKVILISMEFDIYTDNGSNLGFSDVQKGAWYMKYIRTAKSYGIVKGYASGTFKPDNQLSKAEAVTILLNAAKERNGLRISSCNVKPYLDVNVNDWFVNQACYAKYVDLTGDDYYFNPNTLFTRGEMVKLLYRADEIGVLIR